MAKRAKKDWPLTIKAVVNRINQIAPETGEFVVKDPRYGRSQWCHVTVKSNNVDPVEVARFLGLIAPGETVEGEETRDDEA